MDSKRILLIFVRCSTYTLVQVVNVDNGLSTMGLAIKPPNASFSFVRSYSYTLVQVVNVDNGLSTMGLAMDSKCLDRST
jgi:NCAIR mutase (PurE)-related protein